ncbi:hypothetical protein KIL84_010215 [Mauremys mutica]|uniref:Uncharacterized protein n=1 Tax=Mauremys mutica TaxID=74926 RepID=A0A9D4B6H3_9SAUR|nr:hypothetical protein KIL84_010215 [Mauremys mutica]
MGTLSLPSNTWGGAAIFTRGMTGPGKGAGWSRARRPSSSACSGLGRRGPWAGRCDASQTLSGPTSRFSCQTPATLVQTSPHTHLSTASGGQCETPPCAKPLCECATPLFARAQLPLRRVCASHHVSVQPPRSVQIPLGECGNHLGACNLPNEYASPLECASPCCKWVRAIPL